MTPPPAPLSLSRWPLAAHTAVRTAAGEDAACRIYVRTLLVSMWFYFIFIGCALFSAMITLDVFLLCMINSSNVQQCPQAGGGGETASAHVQKKTGFATEYEAANFAFCHTANPVGCSLCSTLGKDLPSLGREGSLQPALQRRIDVITTMH